MLIKLTIGEKEYNENKKHNLRYTDILVFADSLDKQSKTATYCQFHQHFTTAFFVQKSFLC
jgi:hypothetical protein